MTFSHLNPEKLARALSLTGGGVRGVFTAGILAELERRIECNFSRQFDVLVGTSVGGIIAIGLACGISGKALTEALSENVGSVFGKPARFNPGGLRTTRHRPDRLRECLEKILGDNSTKSIRSLDRNIVVPSIDAISNRVVYFSNVERIGETRCLDASLLDVALATSAAPTYFPPHKIGARAYLDGGIASNNPDIEALRFCLASLSRTPAGCLLLSVGSGQNFYLPDPGAGNGPGALSWVRKYSLIDRIMSLQESKSSELASELIGDRYLRLDTTFETAIELDDCRDEVVRQLRRRAEAVVDDAWASDAPRLASLVR